MWRLVTSLKRAGDSKLIRTCDDCLSCLQVGRVTATEKRDPHVALKAHFKPLELCIWLPCPCQRFRMLILRRPMRRSSLARKGHTRRSVVSWISESRFLSPLDPSLVQERRVRMLAQIRRDSLYLRKRS